jgi:hypothetical protein
MMSPDSTWHYKTITLYLKTNKCACSYVIFNMHAPGGVAQHMSRGLTLCALMHILRSKVVWVGFHI